MVDFMINATAWMDVYASNMNNIFIRGKMKIFTLHLSHCEL
jgi:hypothetical protein